MTYSVGPFDFDPAKFEIRLHGAPIAAEPQVLSMLFFLIENRHRLVTKDNLIEAIWKGRAISDSAISSRLKAARQLLGDDGSKQRLIRTVHGKGFRFVGEVHHKTNSDVQVINELSPPPAGDVTCTRPAIAVLPFAVDSTAANYGIISDALPHDLITELSRLRWLRVIARGSTFRFRGRNVDIEQVGRMLGVGYCLTGSAGVIGRKLLISVELADTACNSVLWAERFEAAVDDIHTIRETIIARVVTALELQIPRHEAEQARLRPVADLDAWSNYHLALQHMFRFNRDDNQRAMQLFELAVRSDRRFARAHAGLSFTRFQNAFLGYSATPKEEAMLARKAAERALELDEFDPFANLTMGRSLWLQQEVESSLAWLERATSLSPNYAHAVYSLGWAKTILNQATEGQQDVIEAARLSPLDPLHYAMTATRALSLSILGEDQQAAALADRAAKELRAHVLIAVIAAACHELAGNEAEARSWAANVHSRAPQLTRTDFFRSFPFTHAPTSERLSHALATLGL